RRRLLNKCHNREAPCEQPRVLVVAVYARSPKLLNHGVENSQHFFQTQPDAPRKQALERADLGPAVPTSWQLHQLQDQLRRSSSVERCERAAEDFQSIIEWALICRSFALRFD